MRKPTLSLLAVVLSTACGTGAQHTPTPEEQRELEPLAAELNQTPMRSAMGNRSHFAPLCDENGYPLVGNVYGKVPPETTVAEFCAELSK